MSIDHHSKCRGRWITCAGAIAATALAAAAVHAQVTQPNDPGVMSFPNVRVINKTPAADQASPGAPLSSGMRAYMDPETGALTENPTPAHLEDLEVRETTGQIFGKKASGPAPTFRTSGGAIRATLGDSFLMYSVARRAGDGDVEWACVPGDAKARDFLSGRGERLPHVHSKPVAGRGVK